MCRITSLAIFLFMFAASDSFPVNSLLEVTDSELVGSKLSKSYVPAPFDDLAPAGSGHRSRGGDAGEHEDEDGGYYTSKSKKGDNGYKHFDSYHKKGGDKYGYETHSSYGKSSGGDNGGSHKTAGHYHRAGNDGKTHEGYYHQGNGKRDGRDHKEAATDGDYHYSNYESDGEGDSEHFEDSDHYDGDDGGHYSEGYYDGDGDSEGYYDGEGDSEGYYDGEDETKQKTVIYHGGPQRGATSYSVRHY